MNGLERRYLDRFYIPDAKIRYLCKDERSACVPLADFTKISARFSAEHNLREGDPLDLELLIPDKEAIMIKGIVILITEPDSNHSIYHVVQFLPFGSDERYNSMESHKQLTEVTVEYLQAVG
jgi:hypothetical protein